MLLTGVTTVELSPSPLFHHQSKLAITESLEEVAKIFPHSKDNSIDAVRETASGAYCLRYEQDIGAIQDSLHILTSRYVSLQRVCQG